MVIEFLCWVGWGGMQSHFHVQPNFCWIAVELTFSWGFDKNYEISWSSMFNNNFGAINNWKNLNGRDSLNVPALSPIFMVRLKNRLNAQVLCAGKNCPGSVVRLNTQAQCSGSILMLKIYVFCAKKVIRLNVEAQCLGLMRLIYLVYFR